MRVAVEVEDFETKLYDPEDAIGRQQFPDGRIEPSSLNKGRRAL